LEIRNAIASYEEPSPLFGFLRYRRRNVVIKYVPEDCSRLVQGASQKKYKRSLTNRLLTSWFVARVTVHFNAVTDRFSPHDTVFPITTSKELRDSTLSAACSLHTASGSTSSSTSSLRRRRLMEIAEDEEEDRRQSTVLEEKSLTVKPPSVEGSHAPQSSVASTQESVEPHTVLNPQSLVTEPESEPLTLITSAPPISEDRPSSPTQSIEPRRNSSQLTRPDINSYNSYPSTTKKIKLGPRPSLDTFGRPQTSGANYRPVSTLPAGLKLFSRASKKPNERPKSQYPSAASNMTPSMTVSPPASDSPTPPPLEPPPARPHTSGGRPSTSSSFKSTLSSGTVTPKVPALTPEKARLAKALELRKKQMNAPQPELLSPTFIPDTASISDRSILSDGPLEEDENLAKDDSLLDSGISIEVSSTRAISESDVTASSSTPASPHTLSEEQNSTRASSVSDSTDETVQALPQDTKSLAIDEVEFIEDFRGEADEGGNVLVTGEIIEQEASEEIVSAVITLEIAQEQTLVHEEASEDSEIANNDKSLAATESTDSEIPATHHSDITPEVKVNGMTPLNNQPEEQLSAEPEQDISSPSGISQEDVTSEAETETSPVAKSPVKELMIPRSKFSVQKLQASDTASSGWISTGSKSNNSKTLVDSTKTTIDSHCQNSDNQEAEATQRTSPKKRRALIEPIRTDLNINQRSRPVSEIDFLADDDLMDELQSATVQEAKPFQVSKSPMKPVFPRDIKKGSSVSDRFSRAFSNPLKKDSELLSPQESQGAPSRSVSASAYLSKISQQQSTTPPLVKKVNLGSGISQRIKALEKLSGSSSPPVPPPTVSSHGPSPTFFSVRKSTAQGSKSPSIADRANSFTGGHTPSPSISRDSSPEAFKLRDRSFSIQSRKETFNTSPTAAIQHRSRPESISVTARIIRDPAQPYPQKPEIGKDPSDFTRLDLKQSPLLIDHQRARPVTPQQPSKETIQERRLSNPAKEGKKERRSSITIVKDLIADTRSSFAERRKSINLDPSAISSAISSIRSPSRPPSTHTNSPTVGRPLSISSRRSSRDFGNSLSSSTSVNALSPSSSDENIEKKASRASRMLHRMSSSLSSGRKSLAHAISPTVREDPEPPMTAQSMAPSNISILSAVATTAIEMGDVNVQFPDNLLWKRRSMRLDSQGFLVLSQAQGSKATEKSAGTKKYHLGDFRVPVVPDVEAEELPNSVVLDFLEGGGLQVACEDRAGQVRILQRELWPAGYHNQ
jgi:hypothetical protein